MKTSTISKGFLFAGLANILGVLTLSKFFTNNVLMNTQPDVMGYFGLISIILWGMAYVAVRNKYHTLPALVAVFLIEKIIYVTVYINWFTSNSLSAVYEQDAFAGVFYTIYGANDFIFGVFFAVVLIKLLGKKA
ncbi:hypothetical protein [Brumimicrobium oceani]|uniref:Uncharacterized protein n=1 Tax=Brumimicrobium oceani TaxID=2100725 RepID=A0A2U2XAT8_9FLAO|nr:hypothetical protein [Brumimicrobium oceani]PWH84821.1 hypothetical protein DIT68_12910 [Brumimicrobium oceani]